MYNLNLKSELRNDKQYKITEFQNEYIYIYIIN